MRATHSRSAASGASKLDLETICPVRDRIGFHREKAKRCVTSARCQVLGAKSGNVHAGTTVEAKADSAELDRAVAWSAGVVVRLRGRAAVLRQFLRLNRGIF